MALGVHALGVVACGSPIVAAMSCVSWASTRLVVAQFGIVGKPHAFSGLPRIGWSVASWRSWAAITLPRNFVGCHTYRVAAGCGRPRDFVEAQFYVRGRVYGGARA